MSGWCHGSQAARAASTPLTCTGRVKQPAAPGCWRAHVPGTHASPALHTHGGPVPHGRPERGDGTLGSASFRVISVAVRAEFLAQATPVMDDLVGGRQRFVCVCTRACACVCAACACACVCVCRCVCTCHFLPAYVPVLRAHHPCAWAPAAAASRHTPRRIFPHSSRCSHSSTRAHVHTHGCTHTHTHIHTHTHTHSCNHTYAHAAGQLRGAPARGSGQGCAGRPGP